MKIQVNKLLEKDLMMKIKRKVNRILTERKGTFSIIDIRQLENQKIEYLSQNQKCAVYYPRWIGMGEVNEAKVMDMNVPDIYMAKLSNVYAYGYREIVTIGGKCIFDEMVRLKKEELSMDYARKYMWYDYDNKKIEICYRQKNILCNRIVEKAISLLSVDTRNYYHFVIDVLTKLYYIRNNDIYSEYKILVDEEAWEHYGKLIEDVYEIKNNIIKVSRWQRIKVKELLYISRSAWNDEYTLTKTPILFSGEPMSFVRNRILEKYKNETVPCNNKVIISRKGFRRLQNQEEIENIASKYGFQIVVPEDLSLEEEITLFTSTKYMIGTMGAGLTNLMWLPQDAHIIQINTSRTECAYSNMYATMAYQIGLTNYTIVECEETGSKGLNVKENKRTFSCDTNVFEDTIKNVLNDTVM